MHINNYNTFKVKTILLKFFYITIFFLFLISCKTIDKKYLEENKPTISVHSVNIESIYLDTINFTLNLKIKNNYNFDIILTKLNANIKNKNGTYFASITKNISEENKSVKIKTLESEVISFSVKGNYTALIETFLLFFVNTKIELYAEGDSVFSYKGFNVKVPINTMFEINTSENIER